MLNLSVCQMYSEWNANTPLKGPIKTAKTYEDIKISVLLHLLEFELFFSDINASLANVVGAHATVDLVVGILRACLVRLVLSLGAIASLFFLGG